MFYQPLTSVGHLPDGAADCGPQCIENLLFSSYTLFECVYFLVEGGVCYFHMCMEHAIPIFETKYLFSTTKSLLDAQICFTDKIVATIRCCANLNRQCLCRPVKVLQKFLVLYVLRAGKIAATASVQSTATL